MGSDKIARVLLSASLWLFAGNIKQGLVPTRDVCLSRSVVLGRGLLGSYGLKTLKGNRISGGRTLNSGREEEGEGQGERDRRVRKQATEGGREGEAANLHAPSGGELLHYPTLP